MPIKGRTIQEAARQFQDHMNCVLSRTVTQTRIVAFGVSQRPPRAPRIQIAFRQGLDADATRALMSTRFGRMGLYLGQVCEAVPAERRVLRLQTIQYKYTISAADSYEPIFRWEYVRQPEETERWCRHHLQGPIALQFNSTDVNLNELHLPTGYVPFEEVLRFCIVDLGVAPLSEEWDEILTESYTRFKGDFLRT